MDREDSNFRICFEIFRYKFESLKNFKTDSGLNLLLFFYQRTYKID